MCESLAEQDEMWLTARLPNATEEEIGRFIEWVGRQLADNNRINTDQARQTALGWLVESRRK